MSLSNLSDAQVEDRIQRLALNQRAIYLRELGEVRDKRQALFIAMSYPEEESPEEKHEMPFSGSIEYKP